MAESDQKKHSDLDAQAIALAEQLGRLAGTVQGTAESWMKHPALTEQLAAVRDGAARMLQTLGRIEMPGRRAAAPKKKKKKAAGAPRASQRVDPSRAPGKRRRKPAPTLKGVKKSDERIPKLRTATAVRQRRKSYA